MPPGFAIRDKLKGDSSVVINASLIRECIHIPNTMITDDGRNDGGGSKLYQGRGRRTIQKNVALTLELHKVTCLIMSHQFIGKIDNLVGLPALTKLCLDNNKITKIENLGHLTTLTWLDLSFNQIREIEGLDNLVLLEDLSLYSNNIIVVKGLDTLKSLKCLSLGENQIESLDETSKYLHTIKSIRMLTLHGNKICLSKQYKSRIMAFIGDKLRYLDNRLVLPKDIEAAKEVQNEHFVPIREEDETQAEAQKANIEAEKEIKLLHELNCPGPSLLLDELEALVPETSGGYGVKDVLGNDELRDRCRDLVEKYRDDIVKTAQKLYTFMEKVYSDRSADIKGFNDTIEWSMKKCDGHCREIIREYEKLKKRAISSDPHTSGACGDNTIAEIMDALAVLKEELLELEVDQFNAFASVLDVYEDTLTNYKASASEMIQTRFDDLRQIDKQFSDDIKNKVSGYFDDKSRQDANDMIGGYQSRGVSDDPFARLLENKEECLKIVSDCADLHSKRLDEMEEYHKKREDSICRETLHDAQEREHRRHRARIAEIGAYCQKEL
eukprot:Tbor_TRINITY_DN6182_c2_g1::TRINITY_DN6182_c2_g1_i1::g.22005::m.22005